VEGRDGRDVERTDEVEDVVAILAAPDPEFVLDRDDIGAVADDPRGRGVIGALIPPDPVMDLERIGCATFGWEQDDDLAVARRRGQIVGEARRATATRGIRGDESSPSDQMSPLDGSAPRGRWGRVRS
jgi:hypothetical protein